MCPSCECLFIFHIPRLIRPAKTLKSQEPQTQPLPRRSHYEVWEKERLIVLGGGVTGELQDTWKGIQRRLRGEHEGVHVCVFIALRGCEMHG